MSGPGADDARHEREMEDRVEQLLEVLQSRATIARAQGMLMERYALSDDAAMALLKRISSDTNLRVRHIAEKVLGGASVEKM